MAVGDQLQLFDGPGTDVEILQLHIDHDSKAIHNM